MISRSLLVIGSVPFLVSPNKETTRNPQAREKHKQPQQAPAPNQTSDSHQQAEQSTTEVFREWPDIPPTWELERDARGHREVRTSPDPVRNDAATSHPSGSTEPAISYTVHTKMHQHVLDQTAGLTRDGWRKK